MFHNRVEHIIWSFGESEFEDFIKFIPDVQQDAYSVIFFLKMRISDLVQVKGYHISEDGIKLRNRFYPWPETDSIRFFSLRKRLLNIAKKFPQARLFEARKPIIKAKDDLRREFRKGQARQARYSGSSHVEKSQNCKLPNFLVLGVPKAATTWLYQCLDEHPEVFVPEKELEFFSSYRYYYGIKWYKQHFDEWSSEVVGGDVSIGYFQSLDAPKRICRHLNCRDLKLIVVLREPIARALSYYEMRVLKGEMVGSFEESLKIPYYWQLYIETGHYDRYFKNYLKYFSREQILVLLYEEIKQDSGYAMKKVFKFVGVNPNYQVNTVNRKSNVGRTIRNPSLHKAFTKSGFLLQVMLPWFGIGVRLRNLLIWISQKINFFKSRQDYHIDPVVFDRLRQQFQPSKKKLAEIIDIDLSLWG